MNSRKGGERQEQMLSEVLEGNSEGIRDQGRLQGDEETESNSRMR